MRLFLVYLFYYLGDIISRTTMVWFDGFGYSIYSKIMNLSVNLDTEHKIWKPVKRRKNDNIKRYI
jgi:hypothetical protein